MEIGFQRLKSDPCVYVYSKDGVIVILTLYVDDVLLLGNDVVLLERIKQKLIGPFLNDGQGRGVASDRDGRYP